MPVIAWILFTLAPVLVAATWTLYPAVRVGLARVLIKPIPIPTLDLESTSEQQKIRRLLQQHFRNFGHYLPFEDIVILGSSENSTAALLVQKACGRGKILVWLSYSFNLPIIGTKVVEHCWKPPVTEN